MTNKKLTNVIYGLLILGVIYLLLLLYFTPGLMTAYLNMFPASNRNHYSGWAFLLTIITFVILVMIPIQNFSAANKLAKYNNRTIHYADLGFSRYFIYFGGLVILGIIANKEINLEIDEFEELLAEKNA